MHSRCEWFCQWQGLGSGGGGVIFPSLLTLQCRFALLVFCSLPTCPASRNVHSLLAIACSRSGGQRPCERPVGVGYLEQDESVWLLAKEA
jgi:hypothetical protein